MLKILSLPSLASVCLLAIGTLPFQSQNAFAQLPSGSGSLPHGNNASAGTRAPFCDGSTPEQPFSLVTSNGEPSSSDAVLVTTSEHPTLFAYIPPTEADKVTLTLIDNQDNLFYYTELPIPEAPGVVSFTVPDDAPALAFNQPYKWNLSVVCGNEMNLNDPRIAGWIQRTESTSNLANQVNDEDEDGDEAVSNLK
jgi:hypothetical protein